MIRLRISVFTSVQFRCACVVLPIWQTRPGFADGRIMKIAQPFMAGAGVKWTSKSRHGRQKAYAAGCARHLRYLGRARR